MGRWMHFGVLFLYVRGLPGGGIAADAAVRVGVTHDLGGPGPP
ncbi:hypothetical protein DVS28_a3626 [Euzebya pacifica]|uniref:Uncharacterized protein n=1 Tax=Euzebya pacifica TaxID=1608957 RepID=A0A346Y1F2_9ACTN|nr:hypothetical protein DVS28_a3626 [Euzebya pacifica]